MEGVGAWKGVVCMEASGGMKGSRDMEGSSEAWKASRVAWKGVGAWKGV